MENQELFYLREDVFVEPLINSWYAWSYLITPLPYSMYMSKTHRRLMNSFIKDSELHAIAIQDTSLANVGEFVGCKVEQVEEVKALLQTMETEYSLYLELARAIKELDDLVRNHRTGESIEPLYAKVPDLLKGYVELFMDIYHQPSYRLLEGLIYKSRYYNTQLQSVTLGILNNSTDRAFVMSTPRLITEDTLNIKAPFESPLLDQLFRTREHPVNVNQIAEMFEGQSIAGGLTPKSLFTTISPLSSYQNCGSDEVRLQYVGHAGLLIETCSNRILLDPIIAYRTDDIADKVISFRDLPAQIDYICLTHNHADHVNFESLLQLRYKTKNVLVPKNNGGSLTDPSLKLLLQKLKFNVYELEDLEEIKLDGGRIVSIPFLGEHGDLNIRSKTAWFIELNGKKIYAGADASNLDSHLFKHVHEITGDLDILAIGMECVGAPYTWLYGALTTEPVGKTRSESRRLNGADFEKAMPMVDIFNPKQVLIYALGLEPWYQYLAGIAYSENAEQIIESGKLIKYCEGINIPARRLGEKYEIVL